jgi:hypothetical protein
VIRSSKTSGVYAPHIVFLIMEVPTFAELRRRGETTAMWLRGGAHALPVRAQWRAPSVPHFCKLSPHLGGVRIRSQFLTLLFKLIGQTGAGRIGVLAPPVFGVRRAFCCALVQHQLVAAVRIRPAVAPSFEAGIQIAEDAAEPVSTAT